MASGFDVYDEYKKKKGQQSTIKIPQAPVVKQDPIVSYAKNITPARNASGYTAPKLSNRQFGIGMRQTQAQPKPLPYAGKVSENLPQYSATLPKTTSKVPVLPYYQEPGISSGTWKKQAEQLKQDVSQQQKTVRPWQNTSGTMQTASYMKTPQAFQKDGRAMSIEKPESVVRNEQKLSDLKSSLANAQNQGYFTDYSEQWRAIESRDDAEDVKAKLSRMASMKNNIGSDMGQNIASMNEYQRLRGELESKGINAEGVADWLRRNSNVMEAYYQQQRDAARAEEHPIIESLKTVPQSLYGGTGALAGVTQSAMNSRTGEYRPIDTMGDAFDIARARQTVRGTVGEKVAQAVYEGTGNQTLANAANFLYGTAMSGLDSAFIAALGGGATAAIGATGGTAAINGAASIILGSNAASETMMDVVNRGGSTDQAIAAGILSGAAETIFEKVSIEGLISKFKSGEKGFRAFIKNATLQGASEASEEMATEIANVIADYYVNGGLSEIEQMRQSGMSDVEIANEIAKRVGVAGAGGFLMGFVGGGAANLTGGISKGGKNRTAAEYAGLYGSYKNNVSTDISPVESVSEQGQQITPTAAENAQNRAVQSGNAAMSLARQYAGQNISNSQATEILDDPESVKEMTDAGVDLSGTSSQRRKAVKDYVQGIAEQPNQQIPMAEQSNPQQIPYAPGFNPDSQASPQQLPRAEQTQPQPIPYNPAAQASETPVQPTLPMADELNAERQKNAQALNLPSYGDNTVGSAQVNPESYAHLQNEYGVVDPGENPARVIDMPVKDAQGQTNSLFARTVAESEHMPDEMVKEWENSVARGDFSHSVATDKAAISSAERKLSQGWDKAMGSWQEVVNGEKVATKNDIALGELLLANAMKDGDTATAMQLTAELCAEATRAGQAVQAMRLLKKMTPQGQLYYLQKMVNNLNEDFRGRRNFNGITIDKGLADNLVKATTREEIDAAVQAIRKNVAEQTPVSWQDRWNAWRYLSMLGNPTTHIRNFFGNALFAPVVSAKNRIAQVIESAFKNTPYLPYATKAVVNKNTTEGRALLEFAASDYDNVAPEIQGVGKYSEKDQVLSERQVLPGIIGKAAEANANLLDAEDMLFSKSRYRNSLASYLKANNITVEQAKADPKVLEQARRYAINEAQKATYRDASYLASILNRAKRNLANTANNTQNKMGKRLGARAVEIGMEGLMPFTKTPINILKRGVEYSPAGLLKGLTYDLYQVKHGNMTAAEAIDGIAAGLTGSALVALGWFMSSMGWVTGGPDEDDRRDRYESMLGRQDYALNIDGKSYTIDWLAPEALPYFVGVALQENRGDDATFLERFLGTISTIAEPMIEMSMLEGVNSSLEAVKYSEGFPLGDFLGNLATSYAGQGIPTVFGKVARSIDPTSRQTYYDPNKTGVVKAADVFRQKAQAKSPWEGSLQPRVDLWGREEQNTGGNVVGRFFYNMLSPGYLEKKNVTKVDNELMRLAEATNDSNVYPDTADKTFKVNGESVKLGSKQYTQFAKTKGQTAFEILEAAVDSSTYKKMTDAEKADFVKDVYEYANAKAKAEISSYQLDGKNAKIAQAEQKGIKPAQYLTITSGYDKDGNGSVTQEEAKAALDKSGLTTAQKAYMWKLQNKGWKNNPYE